MSDIPIKCDQCEALATHSVVDMMFDGSTDGWANWKPHGAVRNGCQLHSVSSVRYLELGRVANQDSYEIMCRALVEADKARAMEHGNDRKQA